MNRRDLLKLAAGALASLGIPYALPDEPTIQDDIRNRGTIKASKLNDEALAGRLVRDMEIVCDEDLYILPGDRYEHCDLIFRKFHAVVLATDQDPGAFVSCSITIDFGNHLLVAANGTPFVRTS